MFPPELCDDDVARVRLVTKWRAELENGRDVDRTGQFSISCMDVNAAREEENIWGVFTSQ